MTTPVESTEQRSVELAIGGMTCASCAARIEKKLNRIDGVSASVNYATEKARVTFAPDVAPEDLVATVEATGYTAALPAPPADDGPADDRPPGWPRTPRQPPGASALVDLRRCSRSRSCSCRWSLRSSSTTGSGSR